MLVLLVADNSVTSITAYLTILRSGHAVILANSTADCSLRMRIVEAYSPEIIVSSNPGDEFPSGYKKIVSIFPNLSVAFAERAACTKVHNDTALLLSTSGTTGSPKLVRLSYENIQANAASIAEYLDITSEETAVTSLPLSYSYGLSVVNSHLWAGAELVCTNNSVVSREFWDLFKGRGCTSFAGVPFTYQMLEKMRIGRMDLPRLKTMTQAGGRLPDNKIKIFAELAQDKNFRFFVMYGQTEATARMSYVPFERLTEKIGSVGIAIPGGKLTTVGVEGECGSDSLGEIVYEGSNVMHGYAESRECLSKDNELKGTLYTGDVGYKDSEGYLYITGRLKRFIKLLGLRLNLDEIERMLEGSIGCPAACLGNDEQLVVLVEAEGAGIVSDVGKLISGLYKLHHSAFRVISTSALPVTTSGKKDYKVIEQEIGIR